jgi:hypothetical protein
MTMRTYSHCVLNATKQRQRGTQDGHTSQQSDWMDIRSKGRGGSNLAKAISVLRKRSIRLTLIQKSQSTGGLKSP